MSKLFIILYIMFCIYEQMFLTFENIRSMLNKIFNTNEKHYSSITPWLNRKEELHFTKSNMVSSILKKKNWGYNETTSWLMDLLWAVWLYMRVNTPIFFLSKLKRHCILSCNVKRINISSIEKIKAKYQFTYYYP